MSNKLDSHAAATLQMDDQSLRLDFLANRPRHPPSSAITFLENRVQVPGQAQTVFVERLNRVDSLEVAEKQQKISDDLWKQANEEKNKLFSLVEQVQAKLDKKSGSGRGNGVLQGSSKVDLQRCTWDQVMNEVQSTATRWSTTPNRENKRKYLDKIGRNGDAFNDWLQLLPSGDYGSSICGVFALAIGVPLLIQEQAASQYSKVEDAIVEALASIPETIEGARRYVSFYSQSREHRLEEKTFDLYLAILKALSHIMRFFADSSIRRFCGPLFLQSSYQQELLESIDYVKTRAARVKEEADQCLQMRVTDMDKSLRIQGEILQDTNQTSSQTLQNSSLALQMMRAMHQQLMVQQLAVQQLVLQGSSRETLDASRPRKAIAEKSQSRKGVDDLLRALRYDPEVVTKDIDKILQLGTALDDQGQAKAASLINNADFKAYMTEHDFSAPLLVNGNDDMSAAEGLSPLGLVSAKLARMSEQTESAIALSYFCSEHPVYGRRSSPISAPVEMMSTLLGQLISQMHQSPGGLDVSFLENIQWKKVEVLDPKALFAVFVELVQQLPEDTLVFCIIDEPVLYETAPCRQTTMDIFRRLTRLVRKSSRFIFKFLVTCRGRSMAIYEHFIGHTVDMEELVEEEDSSAWTIANMGHD